MRTLSIANAAAKSGKSTLTRDLASALVRLGQRVLVVDADLHAQLTWLCGKQEEVDPIRDTIANVFETPHGQFEAIEIQPHGFDLVGNAFEIETIMAHQEASFGSWFYMRSLRETAAISYDWMLIDCPPNLGRLALGSLIASDYVLVPMPLARHKFVAGYTLVVKVIEQKLDQDLESLPPPVVLGIVPIGGVMASKGPAYSPVEAENLSYAASIIGSGQRLFESIPWDPELYALAEQHCDPIDRATQSMNRPAKQVLLLAQQLLQQTSTSPDH